MQYCIIGSPLGIPYSMTTQWRSVNQALWKALTDCEVIETAVLRPGHGFCIYHTDVPLPTHTNHRQYHLEFNLAMIICENVTSCTHNTNTNNTYVHHIWLISPIYHYTTSHAYISQITLVKGHICQSYYVLLTTMNTHCHTLISHMP